MKHLALIVVVALAALAVPARADRVVLAERDAPKEMWPAAAGVTPRSLDLSPAQVAALGKALGLRISAARYPYLDVRDAHGAPLGVIFLLDVIGQSQPISFAVGITPDGTIRDVAVLVYREAHGGEIADPRFRRQFAGKREGAPLELGRDIDAISGATISSRAATYAARKALALDALLRAGGR